MGNDNDQNESAATQLLHSVLAEYIRRRDAGDPVDIESFCMAYPDLADGLRSYADGEGLLQALADPASVDSSITSSAETLRPGAGQRTDPAPQADFGRYRLIRQLGNGAMGAVYLAEDTHLGRQVALKIPRGTGTEGPEFLQRFTREARAAAQLEHPNLCRIYDAGDVNGTPFISMEYIDGPPLSQCVGVADYLDQRRIAEIVSEIAAGLQVAHTRGILHRDVKSGNVLMKNGEIPCVTDFGLARMEGREESKITRQDSILGTPAYMAPEQIRASQHQIGPHSDVYALGVVLYELLAGHTPFQGSVLVILNQALNDRPPSLQKVRADVDRHLADFCLQMLEKEPEQRPQSMQAVVVFLQQWLKTTSPESKTQQAKEKQAREKYELMKSKVLSLIQRGQYAQAVAALEKMQQLKGSVAADYSDWASKKLPEVKKLPQQLKQSIPALLATAKQFMHRHDYGQAAQLLQDIPPDFRSPALQQTLDKALELQEEADLLLLSLQDCVRTKQLEGIEDNLKRFLKLKPGSKFARDLWDSLQSYDKLPSNQRRYRFNEKGQLQPLSSGSIWDNWLLWGTLCFVVVFGLAYGGIMIYILDGMRTLAVEVNEDWLREQGGQLTLSVDGKEHTISAGETIVKVAFGEHGFSVKHNDTIVHDPQTFTIKKGTTQILQIDASGMRLAAIKMASPSQLVQEQDSTTESDTAAIDTATVDTATVNTADTGKSSNPAEDWVSLFNGRDLSEWRHFKGGPVKQGWSVQNGEIRVTGDGEDIMTERVYANFELEFEWAMPNGGNSGILYRAGTSGESLSNTAIEYQLFDDPSHPKWSDPKFRSGSIWPLYGSFVSLKPRGQFNTSRIVIFGNQITHWLNGTKTAEATIGSANWRNLGNVSNKARPNYATLTSGHIGLQTYGKDVRFRNLRIREISINMNLTKSSVNVSAVNEPPAKSIPFPENARFIKASYLLSLNRSSDNQVASNAYPWVSPNGLMIWWTREGIVDKSGIYQATRKNVDSQFENIQLVLPEARIASISPDGLEIVCLCDANQTGSMDVLGSCRRVNLNVQFPRPQQITPFKNVVVPKGTAFSVDGRQLLLNSSRLGIDGTTQILRSIRSSINAPWSDPRPVTFTGILAEAKWTWPSLTADGRHVIGGYYGKDKSEEFPVVANATADPYRFSNSRPIMINGRQVNARCVRYCAATGELFYCRPRDDVPPYKIWELWGAEGSQ
ncbi:MAG TPA: hypothetical protein DIW81_08145 [Planctomycetaceae bacterium]|nr:hypothetical protein [Rubinisphaera sp.]HCS51551.1 hypothetical protein [Planctomycetaceae bacterium]